MSTATVGIPYVGTVSGYSSGVLQGYLAQVESDLRLVERELRSVWRYTNAGSASLTTREIAATQHVLVVLRSVRKLLTEAQDARPDSRLGQ